MAEDFKFELVSPEKLQLSAEAVEVTVPGSEGDFGVLAHHAPVISTMRPGMIVAKLADGNERSFFVKGGIADVSPSGLTVLSEFAVPAEEFDREAMDQQLEKARGQLEEADTEAKKIKAESLLNQLNEAADAMAA